MAIKPGRLRLAAITLGAATLALGFVSGASASESQPVTPESRLAPASQQFHKEHVTTVGELRTVDGALRYDTHRQVITHPGATYIKVHFASLELQPGEYVTVSSPDGEETYRYGAGEDSGYTKDGEPGFWAMSVDGDTAVVKLHSQRRTGGTVATIDKFWRGYDSAEVKRNNPELQSVCGADARRDTVCYQSSHPTEYERSKAVARLLMGGGACTAWRVGDTNRLLTNAHCFSSQAEVEASEVQFGYECASCGGNNPGAGTKVTGQTMVKTSGWNGTGLDYTLFSVNNFDSITQYGTLYLETREPTAGERIYIPGHGDAAPKRLSIYEDSEGGAACTVKDVATDSYNMGYTCDTSGGNSGSPVLSADHRVIALHHLGGCLNHGARMALIYPEIAGDIDNG